MLDATLPQLVADSYSFRSNGSTKQLDVLANDTLSDSESLQIETVSQGNRGGFVQIAPDGQSLVYKPFPRSSGYETFRYAVTGGVSTDVQVALRAPVYTDAYSVLEQSGTIRLAVMENDDLGSGFVGERRITALGLPSGGGTVEIADDGISLWYTPEPDFKGTEKFEYVVGDQVSGPVTVHVTPLLKSDSFTSATSILSGFPRTLDVLDNDPFTDEYSGERRIALVSTPDHGTVQVIEYGQAGIYTSTPGHFGYDTLHYVVDGRYEAAVSLWVTAQTSHDLLFVREGSGETEFDVLHNDLLPVTARRCRFQSLNSRSPRRLRD